MPTRRQVSKFFEWWTDDVVIPMFLTFVTVLVGIFTGMVCVWTVAFLIGVFSGG